MHQDSTAQHSTHQKTASTGAAFTLEQQMWPRVDRPQGKTQSIREEKVMEK